MTEDELDVLPFGAIRLDKTGKVLSYNSKRHELNEEFDLPFKFPDNPRDVRIRMITASHRAPASGSS